MDYYTTIYIIWQNIKTVCPNVVSEILVRTALLLCVLVVHIQLQRQAYAVTPEELINDYRKPRRDSLVPAWVMMSVIICVPLVILCLPLVLFRNSVESTHALLAWSLAVIVNALLTEVLKVLICRPRPDFFYRCFPNGVVTLDMACTGNVQDVIDGRKSFPSGHSSFSFCSLGFLSLWLYRRLSSQCGDSIRMAILCCVPLVIAAVIGLSRCSDNHHHWQDVVGGGIIGIVSAYCCYKLYCVPSLAIDKI